MLDEELTDEEVFLAQCSDEDLGPQSIVLLLTLAEGLTQLPRVLKTIEVMVQLCSLTENLALGKC